MAEGAVVPVVLGAQRMRLLSPDSERPVSRPGTVQTSVPENGLSCLTVPSFMIVRYEPLDRYGLSIPSP